MGETSTGRTVVSFQMRKCLTYMGWPAGSPQKKQPAASWDQRQLCPGLISVGLNPYTYGGMDPSRESCPRPVGQWW